MKIFSCLGLILSMPECHPPTNSTDFARGRSPKKGLTNRGKYRVLNPLFRVIFPYKQPPKQENNTIQQGLHREPHLGSSFSTYSSQLQRWCSDDACNNVGEFLMSQGFEIWIYWTRFGRNQKEWWWFLLGDKGR